MELMRKVTASKLPEARKHERPLQSHLVKVLHLIV